MALAAVCLAGCDFGPGPSPRPAALEPVAGVDQTGTVSRPVSVPPAVRVLSPRGKPLRGEEVVFSVASGGGQLSGNVRITGQDGVATLGAWILGTTAGPQTVQAMVSGLPPLVFEAEGKAAAPAGLAPVEGDGQTGVVGAPLPVNPAVRVVDPFGNPVDDAPVEFLVTGGGGHLAEITSATDPSGVARVRSWTLGPIPGVNSLSASLTGLTPVIFRATGVPDLPSRVIVLLGDGQSGVVGTPLPFRPTLLVADRFGNLLEGVQVSFEAASGGGAVADGAQVTDATGAAVSGPWTLGPTAGTQTLQVHIQGLAPVVLSATAMPGPPKTAVAQGADTQTGTVATEVPDPPAVRVEDAFGNPTPGVTVLFFPSGAPDPATSPGMVTGGETITGPEGVASVAGWRLGTIAGSYSVTAKVTGLTEGVVFSASAVPATPTSVSILRGDRQQVLFGTQVPVPPSVRVADEYGNGVPEVPVSFAVVEGGGSLSGAQGLTDAQGAAAAGSWTLGPVPGANRITASVAGIGGVVFEAVGLTAAPALVTKVAGDGQLAVVGAEVPDPPRVRVTDAGGNPVSSVTVAFVVTSGGGSVARGSTETGADGIADPGAWTLGTVPGTNTLSATAGDLPPATFSATALRGPAAFVELNGGGDQGVLAGSPVPVPPSVRVMDKYGNPTPGEAVVFTVAEGGGSVVGSVATADAVGVATVGGWALGPAPGVNRLLASAGGLPGLEIQALGWPPAGFQIDVEFMTPLDPSQAGVFVAAAARWEEIIVGDLPDFGGTLSAGGCQPLTDSRGVDDVRIYVTVKTLDGPGGVLGRAGPCYYRTLGGVYPVTGIMELDGDDLAAMEATGILQDVVLHEMGHVLGFGTLWSAATNQLLSDAGGFDPYFNGLGARFAFDALGGSVRTLRKVPVENTGGPGTRDAHWRESVHDAELMTGWIEAGSASNPLSIITIASLADMGYVVNMNAGDPYFVFNPMGAPSGLPVRNRIYIQELPPPEPLPAGGRSPDP